MSWLIDWFFDYFLTIVITVFLWEKVVKNSIYFRYIKTNEELSKIEENILWKVSQGYIFDNKSKEYENIIKLMYKRYLTYATGKWTLNTRGIKYMVRKKNGKRLYYKKYLELFILKYVPNDSNFISENLVLDKSELIEFFESIRYKDDKTSFEDFEIFLINFNILWSGCSIIQRNIVNGEFPNYKLDFQTIAKIQDIKRKDLFNLDILFEESKKDVL
jgi:hypothetical protein